LIGILHNAAELKKEKCYDSSEGSDGKTVKELRFFRQLNKSLNLPSLLV